MRSMVSGVWFKVARFSQYVSRALEGGLRQPATEGRSLQIEGQTLLYIRLYMYLFLYLYMCTCIFVYLYI